MSRLLTAEELAEPCVDLKACIVPTVPTAHGWHCERCGRYVPPEPGRARRRRMEMT